MPQHDTPYLARHALHPPLVTALPETGLGLVVVIPAKAEPAIAPTLDALAACHSPGCAVEVLVVVNAAADCPPAVRRANRTCLDAVRDWTQAQAHPRLRVHAIDVPPLPPKDAGVGLARKIGLDEGVRRLTWAGAPRGVLACLDADCTVAPDYLAVLAAHFQTRAHDWACTLPFAHDLDAAPTPAARRGIVTYELYLRYVVEGLRLAGYPGALHTVGSAMAVRADGYQAQGGMNRRQAGEDFYFLNKFMRIGRTRQAEGGLVIPAPRVSDRVPFGTGAAMARWLDQTDPPQQRAYAPETFAAVAALVTAIPHLGEADATATAAWCATQSAPLGGWLETVRLPARVAEMQRHSASPAGFRSRFLQWFDRFRVMKLAHYLRDHGMEPLPVLPALAGLFAQYGVTDAPARDAEALLDWLRERQQPAAPGAQTAPRHRPDDLHGAGTVGNSPRRSQHGTLQTVRYSPCGGTP